MREEEGERENIVGRKKANRIEREQRTTIVTLDMIKAFEID